MPNEIHSGDFGLEIDDFNRAVRLLRLADYSQLKELNSLSFRRLRTLDGVKQTSAALTFIVGETVEFTGKRGGVVRGTIVKVNRVTIAVQTNAARWSVSPSLLRKVA